MPDQIDLEDIYRKAYEESKSPALATVITLVEFLKFDNSNTASELEKKFDSAIKKLEKIDCRIEVGSVAKIFFSYVTLHSAKFPKIEDLKQELSNRSSKYLKKAQLSLSQLASVAESFIVDDSSILVHSYSRAVYNTLKKAMEKNKRFTIYVTESAPDYKGKELYELLKNEEKCNVTLILDSAVGYIMERIDFVLVGAEGVTESGGIINKIGTYQMAICAKAHNKAVYVLAESYKFVRKYPLSQGDIEDKLKYRTNNLEDDLVTNEKEHPLVDYTPPNYITLLLTDLGPLTTAAVCDMLVQLYT